MAQLLNELDKEIESLLAESGPLSTTEVAERCAIPTQLAYRRCRAIEKRGAASSVRAPSVRTLYYYPATRDVLTNATAPLLRDLKSRVGKDIENRKALSKTDKAAIRRALAAMVTEARPGKRGEVEAFQRQLLAVLKGTAFADLTGVRPFHPPARYFAEPGYEWPDVWPPPPPPDE